MYKQTFLAIAAAAALWSNAQAADISGAGATFPYPVYAKWAEAYKAKTGVAMNYQSIGSGGGIQQIKSKTVDFGASDAPLTEKELNDAGLIQFPTVMGGVVPVIHVSGVKPGELKLDGAALADIFHGKIKKWNDPKIVALNGDLKLPNQAIAVVHRSDGSGTSFIFTTYLSQMSKGWKDEIGAAQLVEWPVGLGGKGNEGVAATVDQTDGSIGYVEYAYALQNKMTHVQMKNKDGKFIQPKAEAFAAAAASADWAKAPGFYMILTDQPGAASWPITAATFILVYKNQDKPENAKQVLDFFNWAYSADGDKLAQGLDYIPMPDSVVTMVQKEWKDNVKSKDGKALWQ
jgi:phosphate transport system substrate-binding protein